MCCGEIRTVQKQIESPCPSVFVLRPDDRPFGKKTSVPSASTCNSTASIPAAFIPFKPAAYTPSTNPQKWLKAMTPHLNRLFGILKYVTPVVGPWLNISAPIYSDLIKNDLALTKALVETAGDQIWRRRSQLHRSDDAPIRKESGSKSAVPPSAPCTNSSKKKTPIKCGVASPAPSPQRATCSGSAKNTSKSCIPPQTPDLTEQNAVGVAVMVSHRGWLWRAS
jgi:hypothetical protein